MALLGGKAAFIFKDVELWSLKPIAPDVSAVQSRPLEISIRYQSVKLMVLRSHTGASDEQQKSTNV